MADLCYMIDSSDNLRIMPRQLVEHWYDATLRGALKAMGQNDLANADEETIKKEVPKFFDSEQGEELKRITDYYTTILNWTTQPVIKFNKVIVLSSMLSDENFLNEHKKLLKDKQILVALNPIACPYQSLEKQNPDEISDTFKTIRIVSNANDLIYTKRRTDGKYDVHVTDDSAATQEQDLSHKIEDLIPLSHKMRTKQFASIKFLENYDGEVEYSFNDLFVATTKIDDVVSFIKTHKNLSPYEKFFLAYKYVYGTNRYKNADEDDPKEISRSLLSILNGDKIVCAGKANLLKAILDKLEIPAVYRGCDGHAICTLALNDPKYNIFGIYDCDPTNIKEPRLVDDSNPIYQEIFVDIEWMSELSEESKKYLMERSGLSKLPSEVLKGSSQRFSQRDQGIIISKKLGGNLSLEARQRWKKTIIEFEERVKQRIEEGKIDELYEKVMGVYKQYNNTTEGLDIKRNFVADIKNLLREYEDIKKSWRIIQEKREIDKKYAAENQDVSTNLPELDMSGFDDEKLDDAELFNQRRDLGLEFNAADAEYYLTHLIGINLDEESVKKALESYNKKIIDACNNNIEAYQLLDSKQGTILVPAEEKLLRLSRIMVMLEEAHARDDKTFVGELFAAVKIDGLETWFSNPEQIRLNEQEIREAAKKAGLEIVDEVLEFLRNPNAQTQYSTMEE